MPARHLEKELAMLRKSVVPSGLSQDWEAVGTMNERPSDSWRQTLNPRGKKGQRTTLVDTSIATIQDGAKWATSMAVVEDTPFVVVGSASRSNNLFIIETIPETADDEDSEASQLIKVRSTFTAPNPIHTLSVSGSHLLTGGAGGCVQVFDMDHDELDQKGRGMAHVTEMALVAARARAPISPPQKMAGSLRIQCLEFAPRTLASPSDDASVAPQTAPATLFLATIGKTLSLCDFQTLKVTSTTAIGSDALQTATWSPHVDTRMIATGGVDRSINVLDARLLGDPTTIVWKVPDAHGGAVTDVRFNPFVPYWLASTGDDRVVKMWDVRYLSHPVARIGAHYHAVHSLAWSNSHAETITTVSSDRSWRAWSFLSGADTRRDDDASGSAFVSCPGSEWGRSSYAEGREMAVIGAQMVGEFSDDVSPLIRVVASKRLLDTYYTLSAVGEVCCHTVAGNAFSPVIPHRFDMTDHPLEHEVEHQIHTRKLPAAYLDVVQICREARQEGKLLAANEKEILELCIPTAPIDATRWTVPLPSMSERTAGQAAVECVRGELDGYTYFLPPKFGRTIEGMRLIKPGPQKDFELAVARCRIVTDVLEGRWDTVVKDEKLIRRGMELDPHFINGNTLRFLIQSILQHDYIKGLSLGLKFVQVIEDTPQRAFSDTADAFGVLLFPTVFDDATWLPPPTPDWDNVPAATRKLAVVAEFAVQALKRDNEEALVVDVSDAGSPVKKGHARGTSLDTGGKVAATGRNGTSSDVKAKAMKRLTETSDMIAPMLRLEIRLSKAVLNPTPTFHADVLRIFENIEEENDEEETLQKRPFAERTVSAYAVRFYFDALIHHERFQEYWTTCFDVAALYAQHDISHNLLDHALRCGWPQFDLYVRTLYDSSTSKLAEALEVDREAERETLTAVLLNAIDLLNEAIVPVVQCGGYLAKLGALDRERTDALKGEFLELFNMLRFSLLRALDVIGTVVGAGCVREGAQSSQAAVKNTLQTSAVAGRRMGGGAGGSNVAGGPHNPAAELMTEISSLVDALGKVGRTDAPVRE
ncbi:hypothetical protein HKX48_003450 [Thoreauomyces humboldtii]|nr:hypothetical protein HKX48_003450 [Thoreauomyces humboldtii]